MQPARGEQPADQLARLLGITVRRLQQLAVDGYIPKGSRRGVYPLVGAVQGYIRFLKESQRETNRSSEHQRLARAQAVKVEMENFRRAGDVVLRIHVHELLTTLMATLVAELEAVPGRSAGEFAATDDAAFIRTRLQDEYRRVRALLADRLEQFAERRAALADAGGDGPPAAQADAEPVGRRKPRTARGRD